MGDENRIDNANKMCKRHYEKLDGPRKPHQKKTFMPRKLDCAIATKEKRLQPLRSHITSR